MAVDPCMDVVLVTFAWTKHAILNDQNFKPAETCVTQGMG